MPIILWIIGLVSSITGITIIIVGIARHKPALTITGVLVAALCGGAFGYGLYHFYFRGAPRHDPALPVKIRVSVQVEGDPRLAEHVSTDLFLLFQALNISMVKKDFPDNDATLEYRLVYLPLPLPANDLKQTGQPATSSGQELTGVKISGELAIRTRDGKVYSLQQEDIHSPGADVAAYDLATTDLAERYLVTDGYGEVVLLLKKAGFAVLPAAATALKDQDWRIRLSCVEAVGLILSEPPPSETPDDNLGIGETTAQSQTTTDLETLESQLNEATSREPIFNELTERLGDKEKAVRDKAVEALGRSGGEPAVPFLIDCLRGNYDRVKVRSALAAIGPAAVEPLIAKMTGALAARDSLQVVAIAETLAETSDARAIAPINACLREPFLANDPPTRTRLKQLLQKLENNRPARFP